MVVYSMPPCRASWCQSLGASKVDVDLGLSRGTPASATSWGRRRELLDLITSY